MTNIINSLQHKIFKRFLLLTLIGTIGGVSIITSTQALSHNPTNFVHASMGTWKYGTFWPYASKVTKLNNSTYRVYYSKNSCQDMASTVGLIAGVFTKSKAIQLAIGGAVISLAHPKHGYRVDIHNPRSMASYGTNVCRWN